MAHSLDILSRSIIYCLLTHIKSRGGEKMKKKNVVTTAKFICDTVMKLDA
jgi:hypothetical protein